MCLRICVCAAMLTVGLSVPAAFSQVTLKCDVISAGGSISSNGAIHVVGQPVIGPVSGNVDALQGVLACWSPTCHPCDTNCDGSINAFDIQSFVDALSASPPTPCSPCAADTNGDGSLNGFDIQGFVECLGG